MKGKILKGIAFVGTISTVVVGGFALTLKPSNFALRTIKGKNWFTVNRKFKLLKQQLEGISTGIKGNDS